MMKQHASILASLKMSQMHKIELRCSTTTFGDFVLVAASYQIFMDFVGSRLDYRPQYSGAKNMEVREHQGQRGQLPPNFMITP